MSQKANYIELANVTMSDQWHGANISKSDLVHTLETVISGLERLDKIKKALFYGRDYGNSGSGPTIETIDLGVTPSGTSIKDGRRLIHGIIGVATEAGEKLEALLKAIDNNEEIDVVNLLEEVGDGFWYDAAICRVAGKTFEDVQETNIAKLQARFPDGFNSFHANNRDLSAEREILVDGAQKTA